MTGGFSGVKAAMVWEEDADGHDDPQLLVALVVCEAARFAGEGS